MIKIVQIATAVSPVQNALGGISMARSVVMVDELGRAFELKDNKWVALPDCPDGELHGKIRDLTIAN